VRWRQLLQDAIPVRQGERGLTALLFLHSFCAVGAFVTGRSARDALLLGAGGSSRLPWLILAGALGVSLMGLAYSPISARFRRDRLAIGGASFGTLVYAGAYLVESRAGSSFQGALYVLVEILGALALLQFWTLVNELFDARSARRLYGLIGAGGTAANILVGLAVAVVARRFGAEALLLQCALLTALMALAAWGAGRSGRQRLFARAASGKLWGGTSKSKGARQALAHPHLRTIALLAAITFFTTTLVDYEYKVIAGATLERDALAAFFGQVSMVVGVLGIAIQLFATGPLLRIAGVIGALAVLPMSLGLGSLALAIFPSLFGATAAKGADSLFRYSINDASTQLLYLPVPAQDRAASKTLIDTVVKPVAIASAALGLAAWQWLDVGLVPLAWVGVLLCACWLAIVLGLHSSYVQVLQQNLTRPRADLETLGSALQDAAGREALARTLSSGDAREVLNALELIPVVPDLEVDGLVEALLAHPEPQVRVAAIRYFARRQQVRVGQALFRAFGDPAQEVRAAAVTAFCALGRDRALPHVRGLLDDPDPGVRGAAITGLIRDGGLDGVVMAAGALKALIAHPDPGMRARAASVLGDIGIQNFYQPLLGLMSDPEPEVRRCAVQAAGQLRSHEFILPLIYRAGSADAGQEAMLSLAAYGTGVLPTLSKVLDNPMEEVNVRRAIARVLGRITSPSSVAVILRHLESDDEELRMRLYRSLARLVRTHHLPLGDRAPVRAALFSELERAWQTLRLAETLGLDEAAVQPLQRAWPGGEDQARAGRIERGRALLAGALSEKVHRVEQRAFLLLTALYPEAGMEQVVEGLHRAGERDPRRRANAVELLDNLLDRKLKRLLLPLLDDASRTARLRSVEDEVRARAHGVDPLEHLLQDESPWVRACTLWYCAEARPDLVERAAPEAAGDESPVVRETALFTLLRVAPLPGIALASRLEDDPSPHVAQCARQVQREAQAA